MWFHSGRRLLARLGLSACLVWLLAVQVVEPPLVFAIPSTPPARRPGLATPGPLTRPIVPAPGSLAFDRWLPVLARRLPRLLAQTSGYDAGSAAASGLLGQFGSPTPQQLNQVPNYSDAARDGWLGNPYYRQAPATANTPSQLTQDASALSTSDPTVQMIQNRAVTPESWHFTQANQLLHSLETEMPPDTGMPPEGCSLTSYCAQPAVTTTTESCQVTQTYEEVTCHEDYQEETQCTPTQTGGSRQLCQDHYLYLQYTADPATGDYQLLALDTGPGHEPHKNCGPSGDELPNGWHLLASVPPPGSGEIPTVTFSGGGAGCTSTSLTLTSLTGEINSGLVCGASGAQSPTLSWTISAHNCTQVDAFHDGCAPYTQAPWFERLHTCLDAVPGDRNDCGDLERVMGNLTVVSSTCDPLESAGCTHTSQTCEDPDCTTDDRTYTCATASGCAQWQQAVVCNTCVPDPPNPPHCVETTTPVSTDFGLAAAVMEGQVAMAHNHDGSSDPPEVYAFPGFAQDCTKNLLVNCCNQGGAQDTATQIQTAITAMQWAMQAYRLSEFIDVTATIMSVGNTLVDSAMTAAQIMSSDFLTGLFAFSWTGVFMVVVIAVSILLSLLLSCDQASTETDVKRDMHLCVDVGEYCSQKVLFFCWEHKEASCCFTTLIARIIQEQGRAQLGIGWGDPRSPDCRGLTVEELQAINWDELDWSEYIAQLRQRVTQPTAVDVQQQANTLMASTNFAGQAAATIDQYGSLSSRVASSITVPGGSLSATVPAPARVTITITGPGTVQISPGGAACGYGSCQLTVPGNQVLTATAIPNAHATFVGWGGACSGTGSCTLSPTGSETLSAQFSQSGYALTIASTGPGTVSVAPGGFTCAMTPCTAVFPPGTTVSLTASPGTSATFDSWTGACTGHGSCTITLTSPLTVGASFGIHPTITALTPTSPGSVSVGTPITWTTTVTGGTPPIEYQFIRADNGTPIVVQDFSTSPAYTWTPTAADIGTHQVQVVVRTAGSTSAGDDSAITQEFTVTP